MKWSYECIKVRGLDTTPSEDISFLNIILMFVLYVADSR